MQTEVETINTYSKKLTVHLSREDIAPIEKKVVRNYQKEADIKGFRRGKAPLSIIRHRYGHLIQQELLEETMKKYYGSALNEADIQPVSQGKITNLQFENIDSGMIFEIEIETEPEFELKKYKGLQVEKDVVEVTDEMVEDSLQRLREQYATISEPDAAQEGHFVHFDAQELDESEVPIVGHKYENLQVELGSGKFSPEMEKQLIGIKAGEKRIVREEAPPEPDDKEQKPQVNKLEIHAKKIEEKEFPELNDEFVKNLDDESLENLDQLREQIHQSIEMELRQRIEQSFNQRLIDELLKENPFDVPPSMVDNYLEEMVKDIKQQSKDRDIDEDTIRKNYRANAIHNIRWYFLIKKIAEVENISVTDEEVRQSIENSNLDDKNKEIAKTNQYYLNRLKEDMMENKVLNLLKENAEVVEVYPTGQPNIEQEKVGNEDKDEPSKK